MIGSHHIGYDLCARTYYGNSTLTEVHVYRIVQACSYCISNERGKENEGDDCVVDAIVCLKLEASQHGGT